MLLICDLLRFRSLLDSRRSPCIPRIKLLIVPCCLLSILFSSEAKSHHRRFNPASKQSIFQSNEHVTNGPQFETSSLANFTLQKGHMIHLPCKIVNRGTHALDTIVKNESIPWYGGGSPTVTYHGFLLRLYPPGVGPPWGQRCFSNDGWFSMVSWVKYTNRHFTILSIGDIMLADDERITLTKNEESSDWGLTISKLKLSDTGIYECQVGTFPKMGKNITLHVHRPPTARGTRTGESRSNVIFAGSHLVMLSVMLVTWTWWG